MVAGILRLSDKYDVPSLREIAVEHLSVVYPVTLEDYASSPKFELEHNSDHLGAIKLARDFDIPWIRPMAVYRYVSQPLNSICTSLHTSGLSEADVDLCIRGVRALKSLQFLRNAHFLSFDNPEGCNKRSGCSSARQKHWDSLSRDDEADPLAQRASPYRHGLCHSCAKDGAKKYNNREKLWSLIPELFADTNWNAVKAAKDHHYDARPEFSQPVMDSRSV